MHVCICVCVCGLLCCLRVLRSHIDTILSVLSPRAVLLCLAPLVLCFLLFADWLSVHTLIGYSFAHRSLAGVVLEETQYQRLLNVAASVGHAQARHTTPHTQHYHLCAASVLSLCSTLPLCYLHICLSPLSISILPISILLVLPVCLTHASPAFSRSPILLVSFFFSPLLLLPCLCPSLSLCLSHQLRHTDSTCVTDPRSLSLAGPAVWPCGSGR